METGRAMMKSSVAEEMETRQRLLQLALQFCHLPPHSQPLERHPFPSHQLELHPALQGSDWLLGDLDWGQRGQLVPGS